MPGSIKNDIDDTPCEGYAEMLKELSNEMKHSFKKSNFYQGNAPAWLEDEFDIKWIKYTDLLEDGVRILMPYEEFISAPVIIDHDKKYDTVILWIGNCKCGGGCTDFELF